MNKRPDLQPIIKPEDQFISDTSQASLPTLANNISKNNLVTPTNLPTAPNANPLFDNEESNILVAVRVRPIISKEVTSGELNIIRPEEKMIVSFYFHSTPL